MQAIMTKFLPYTNTLPSRIKAYTCTGKELTISRHAEALDQYATDEEQHGIVASMLAESLRWYTPTNYLIGGTTEEGFCFVLSDSHIAPKEGPVS